MFERDPSHRYFRVLITLCEENQCLDNRGPNVNETIPLQRGNGDHSAMEAHECGRRFGRLLLLSKTETEPGEPKDENGERPLHYIFMARTGLPRQLSKPLMFHVKSCSQNTRLTGLEAKFRK